jgi:hypothetical protein
MYSQFVAVRTVSSLFLVALSLFGFDHRANAAGVISSATGANAAAIQTTVDGFRTSLGTLNGNVPGSFLTGRREINWDGVPDAFAAPNSLPADFFNKNSPRGVVFLPIGTGTGFQVSATASNPNSTPVEFGNLNATYPAEFVTFSPQRLFTAIGNNVMEVSFVVPGTGVPATVKGFGAVFTDVDRTNGTSIEFFAVGGASLGVYLAPTLDGGLSFLGVVFNGGERISKVRITTGNKILAAGNNDVDGAASASDVVAMDDFIYGEPVGYPDAVAIANDGTDDVIRFNTRTPDLLHSRTGFANLGNTKAVALDIRPSTGELYALGVVSSTGRLVSRDASGSVSVVGPQFTVSGTNFGMDFNPVIDQIRLVSDTEMNITVNPDTGAPTTQSALSPGNPNVVGLAYANNIPGATSTLAFAIDSGTDMLVKLNPASTGNITNVGPLAENGNPINTTGAVGFDIQGYTDTAFATLTVGAQSSLYTVDTDDGNARKVGTAIGANLPVLGFALVPQTPSNFTAPSATDLVALDTSNNLVRFNSTSPGTLTNIPITGLQSGEQAHEIAYRPSDKTFFLLGIVEGAGANDAVGRIYKVNIDTGAATLFGAGPFSSTLPDNANYGFDVHPPSGGFRVVNSADQLLFISSNLGSVFTDTIDNPFAAETVVGLAYDRPDTTDTTHTTAFGIDYQTDSLVQIGSVDEGFFPDSDVVTTIGKTGLLTTNALIGFDISPDNGAAFATMTVSGGIAGLYCINLTNGYAFSLGAIGGGATNFRGLAVVPAPTKGSLANISTRLKVETGDNALIGGFIVTGTNPKTVILRALGPSTGVPGALANPTLELYDGSNTLLRSNDNWQDAPNVQAIIDSTVPPPNALESAILMTLPANSSNYTAVVRGAQDGTGVGLIEAYDLDLGADSKLANISTRGFVQTGDNVLIAGTIVVGQTSQKVIVRAIGPSLPFPGKMENPTLELRDSNATLIAANDNWRSDQQTEIIATTIPPTNDLESAIVITLPSNSASYTAIVRGVNDATGIAVVEVYALN